MDDITRAQLSVPGRAAELVALLEGELRLQGAAAPMTDLSSPDFRAVVPGADEPPD